MEIDNFPFKLNLQKSDLIFIDACFIITFLSIDNIKSRQYINCKKALKHLSNIECNFVTSKIVFSEVMNRMIKILFEIDINSKLNDITPISENIEDILIQLEDEDIYKIGNERISLVSINKLFRKIYKNKQLKYLLVPYFKTSLQLINAFEEKLNLNYVTFNKSAFLRAKNILNKSVIDVNDAEHIAVAEDQNCKYLLTLDGDFEDIESNLIILKI